MPATERAPERCVLCDGTGRALLVRLGEWTVFRCTGCGLGVLDPRPGPEKLASLYRDDYFVTQYDRGLSPGSPEMARRLSQEGHRIRFFRKFVPRGRILDIGCGRGYFLHACRLQGYDVMGYDVSEEAAAYVRGTLGIPVEAGPRRDDLFPEESVDVVTMWHTLEHTSDPREILDRAWRWIRPGGVLVVEVPNYEGTDARWRWAEWEGWQVPYHFYHFTPRTLGEMLSRHGFRATRTKSYHSETVKTRLKELPVVSLVARPVAKFFPGTSYAVVAGKIGQPTGGEVRAGAG